MVNGLGFQGVLGLFLVDPVECGEGSARWVKGLAKHVPDCGEGF